MKRIQIYVAVDRKYSQTISSTFDKCQQRGAPGAGILFLLMTIVNVEMEDMLNWTTKSLFEDVLKVSTGREPS